MRLTGTLRTWNDDRGFGFIAPTHGGAELFVHISALPRDGSRPTVGEKVTYELGRGKNGQVQAVNVRREAIGQYAGHRGEHRIDPTSERKHASRGDRRFVSRISVVLLIALTALGFDQYQKHASALRASDAIPPATAAPALPTTATRNFKCDGRTHCSQMTSCTEAKFFLANCPGTKMDGNHDGTPCEQQWCTGPFAK